MKVYNADKTEVLESYDLENGYLEDDIIIHHYPKVDHVDEMFHYEVVKEYPNGGKDVKKVIDVVGVKGHEAYDEEENIKVYVPYTEEVLQKNENKKRIVELKKYLDSTDWIVTKCLELGLSISETYPEEYQKRTQARALINEIEELLKE